MKLSDIAQIQPKAWSILSRSFIADRVASTYLFHGPNGLGHWPMAISFAALLNCTEPKQTQKMSVVVPCGECHACRSIAALNFEGLHIALPIQSAKNSDQMIDLINERLDLLREEPFDLLSSAAYVSIPIDRAREIGRNLARKATAGIKRCVIFHQMERMKTSSADALLKMIEEPPPETVVILTTDNAEQLLPTIQSRSQRIRLSRIGEEFIENYLLDHYEITKHRARLVVRLNSGNLGRAIGMACDGEEGDGSLRAIGFLLFRSIFMESGPAVASLIAEMVNDRDRGAAEEILKLWQSLLRDCAYYASSGDEEGLVNIDFVNDIKRIAARFEQTDLAAYSVACIKNALADFALNVHIQAAFVALALKLKSRIHVAA